MNERQLSILQMIRNNPQLADVEPEGAPRKEFSHAGNRFMVVELMWHWELRIYDQLNDRWIPVFDEQASLLEVESPGLMEAYSKACDEADASRVQE